MSNGKVNEKEISDLLCAKLSVSSSCCFTPIVASICQAPAAFKGLSGIRRRNRVEGLLKSGDKAGGEKN